ncbi:hypothetical protein LPJ53_004246 [Coemansia erecta]|uniref:PSI domain-containing protein n=1 Tax=Coemansia erecta TaxID=147472 RepID=A0A9W8CPE5_9FUNG|nr:hypothetical protein LPJ53_004246 [Coemansia erecta]
MNDTINSCSGYTSCLSCVNDHRCGYFYNTGVCVPGSWLKPHHNYTDSGAEWSYYHGHCRISTRVEFVVLPSLLGLATLVAAVISLWRWWSYRHNDEVPSCASSQASAYDERVGHFHHHHHNEHNERMPLLIDNDPASRGAAQSSIGDRSTTDRRTLDPNINIVAGAGRASFEEQYGSWIQRSGNMAPSSLPREDSQL